MKRTKNLPKKFACSKCLKEHYLPMYVFAHWEEDLRHLCECGAAHSILRGEASFVNMCRKKQTRK